MAESKSKAKQLEKYSEFTRIGADTQDSVRAAFVARLLSEGWEEIEPGKYGRTEAAAAKAAQRKQDKVACKMLEMGREALISRIASQANVTRNAAEQAANDKIADLRKRKLLSPRAEKVLANEAIGSGRDPRDLGRPPA